MAIRIPRMALCVRREFCGNLRQRVGCTEVAEQTSGYTRDHGGSQAVCFVDYAAPADCRAPNIGDDLQPCIGLRPAADCVDTVHTDARIPEGFDAGEQIESDTFQYGSHHVSSPMMS